MPPPNYYASRKWLDQRCPVLQAAEAIRRQLEDDPAEKGEFLSEGLYYIDEEPLRAFFLIDVESMVVEVTDFRIL